MSCPVLYCHVYGSMLTSFSGLLDCGHLLSHVGRDGLQVKLRVELCVVRAGAGCEGSRVKPTAPTCKTRALAQCCARFCCLGHCCVGHCRACRCSLLRVLLLTRATRYLIDAARGPPPALLARLTPPRAPERARQNRLGFQQLLCHLRAQAHHHHARLGVVGPRAGLRRRVRDRLRK